MTRSTQSGVESAAPQEKKRFLWPKLNQGPPHEETGVYRIVLSLHSGGHSIFFVFVVQVLTLDFGGVEVYGCLGAEACVGHGLRLVMT